MRLKELVLTNFQKHESLKLAFQPGVNYIYGSSDAGKSCIRRAIGFLFFNEPRTDSIRKEGSKQTSVCGILDNGWEIERVKSSSVNRYVVRKDGKELVYDSVGVNIPEEVQKILQVMTVEVEDKEKPLNLNISNQVTLPFLLDKSPSFRLKLFNKLTGNDVLDKLVQNLNKEILQMGKDIRSAQEFVTGNEPKLKDVTIQLSEKTTLLGKFKEHHESIKTKAIQLQGLKILAEQALRVENGIKDTETALRGVKIVSESSIASVRGNIEALTRLTAMQASLVNLTTLDENTYLKLMEIRFVPDETVLKLHELIEKWNTLDDVKGAYEQNAGDIERVKVEMAAVKLIDLDVLALRTKAVSLETLVSLQKNLSSSFDSMQETILKINDTAGNIKILEDKYTAMLKEAGVCPVCKQSTCEVHP